MDTAPWTWTGFAKSAICVSRHVPLFFKQVGGVRPKAGGRLLDGRTWDEYPRLTAGVGRG